MPTDPASGPADAASGPTDSVSGPAGPATRPPGPPPPDAPPSLPAVQVTARLLLRPWRVDDPGDRAAAWEVYRHPDVSRWLGARPQVPVTPDDVVARLRRWAELAGPVTGVFAIVPFGGPDVPVGSTLLLVLPRTGDPPDRRRPEPGAVYEIGWHLHPAAWGRGYATEAGRAMALRARAAGLPLVHAVVAPANIASLAVCDRLGMTRLGPTDAWHDVSLIDHVLDLRP